jgi:hypothetical protein
MTAGSPKPAQVFLPTPVRTSWPFCRLTLTTNNKEASVEGMKTHISKTRFFPLLFALIVLMTAGCGGGGGGSDAGNKPASNETVINGRA